MKWGVDLLCKVQHPGITEHEDMQADRQAMSRVYE
jgi:hypothetical protein